MYRIRSWYNQNRRNIWIVVLIIAGIIGIIQALNSYYKNKTNDKSSSTNLGTTAYDTNNYSVITRKTIDDKTAKQSDSVIEKFLNYCNNGNIEEAYGILSEECKEELYPTIEDFKSKYIDRIFTERKSYDSVLWMSTNTKNTYRIQIMRDLLAEGERDYMPIEEYYTILYENGRYRLNINGYIGEENLNIQKKENNIEINIISRKTYVEYEIYEISVKNKTGETLIFNRKNNTNSTYIQDKNNLKYIAFINEIPDNQFEILNETEKKYSIKFNREYKPNIKIEKIVFGDIGVENSNSSIVIDI